jgi:hypothetical protein
MVHKYIRSGAAVLAAAALAATAALSAPASAAPGDGSSGGSVDPITLLPPGFPCVHTNVYPLPVLEWGWQQVDGTSPTYVTGSGGRGNGYLNFDTPPGVQTNLFHLGISTPLSDLLGRNSLGFEHEGSVTFQLRIRGANRTDGDRYGYTSLVWEPPYNGNVGLDDWADSPDLASGQWWSTYGIDGLLEDAADFATLEEISDANPDAQVTSYGMLLGTAGEPLYGKADDVRYGCARWDFEPLPAGSS